VHLAWVESKSLNFNEAKRATEERRVHSGSIKTKEPISSIEKGAHAKGCQHIRDEVDSRAYRPTDLAQVFIAGRQGLLKDEDPAGVFAQVTSAIKGTTSNPVADKEPVHAAYREVATEQLTRIIKIITAGE
jgi:hypothetical protein